MLKACLAGDFLIPIGSAGTGRMPSCRKGLLCWGTGQGPLCSPLFLPLSRPHQNLPQCTQIPLNSLVTTELQAREQDIYLKFRGGFRSYRVQHKIFFSVGGPTPMPPLLTRMSDSSKAPGRSITANFFWGEEFQTNRTQGRVGGRAVQWHCSALRPFSLSS